MDSTSSEPKGSTNAPRTVSGIDGTGEPPLAAASLYAPRVRLPAVVVFVLQPQRRAGDQTEVTSCSDHYALPATSQVGG